MIKKKILVTGGAGYIGSVLTKKLLERSYSVRVVDCLRWGSKSFLSSLTSPQLEFIKEDLRRDEIQKKALADVAAVIHLAAIVGDPACNRNPELAEDINWQASKSIFDKANSMRIERFIFASTCSNYGRMPNTYQYIDETGTLNPISWYSRLKVKFEQYLLQMPTSPTAATSLRLATAYGVSPRMRFDLTVNEFVKELAIDRKLSVYGEKFWRPYCHVEDLAQACICVLEADRKLIDREVFNVGDTTENYQKQTIVEEIRKFIPDAKVKYVKKSEDPRDYRVSFEKIKNELGFNISKKLPDGIKEIKNLIDNKVILNPDDIKYRNS